MSGKFINVWHPNGNAQCVHCKAYVWNYQGMISHKCPMSEKEEVVQAIAYAIERQLPRWISENRMAVSTDLSRGYLELRDAILPDDD